MSCKGCEKRYVGCHNNCPEYADFIKRQKAIKEAKRNDTLLTNKPSQQLRKIERYNKRYGK